MITRGFPFFVWKMSPSKSLKSLGSWWKLSFSTKCTQWYWAQLLKHYGNSKLWLQMEILIGLIHQLCCPKGNSTTIDNRRYTTSKQNFREKKSDLNVVNTLRFQLAKLFRPFLDYLMCARNYVLNCSATRALTSGLHSRSYMATSPICFNFEFLGALHMSTFQKKNTTS